ncbi:ribonuclease D [Dichotomicrobium thermohalophilum]|nr:ribonuclease D [Dichotomicrobium thermohalophilum]
MNDQPPRIITQSRDLAELCGALAKADYITVDTEFMRESTYWPKLCLIQVASREVEALIDPLVVGDLAAQIAFLRPFFDLMANENVVKVFHSGRQDIEIIYHLAGLIPKPVFDTQIAAMVCGFGESVGYVSLVNKLCRTKLDKTSRFTDWSRRPLSRNQLDYALADVTHLRDVYEKLRRKLRANRREPWLAEEMADLTDPANYAMTPEDAWKRMKLKVRTRRQLAVLMEIAAWRERLAQEVNQPRPRILKDDAINDVAIQAPQSVEELSRLRTISEGFARSARGQEILAAVARGLECELDHVPELKRGEPMPPQAQAVADLLRVLLKAVAARNDVAPRLIATSDDLDKIAVDSEADVHALHGWRRELFGEKALALKAGRLTLGIEDGQVTTFPSAAEDNTERPQRARG